VPERIKHVFDYLAQWGWGWLPPTLLGLLGGIVHLLQQNGCSLKASIASLAAAALSGWVICRLMEACGAPAEYVAPLTAVAGYIGRPLLDILSERVCSLAKSAKP